MSIQRRRFLQSVGAGSLLGFAGCTSLVSLGEGEDEGGSQDQPSGSDDVGQIGDGELVLATTTSTYDSGLLDHLHPAFEAEYGLRVKTLSKGTGASLRTARDGDADVVLVHARPAEDEFIEDGYGVNRRDVMFNDFVILGPPEDPADIHGLGSATEAFATIAEAEATFVSRGDDSGTHKKERIIWDEAGIEPSGQWYQSVGKGMGNTLMQASQTSTYTLSDRGTFRSMRDQLELEIHIQGPVEDGPLTLKNPYGVIAVNPAKYDDVNYEAAMSYIGFLTSQQGQSMIEDYTVDGSPLFVPNALSTDSNPAQYVPQGYSSPEAETRSIAAPRDPRLEMTGSRES